MVVYYYGANVDPPWDDDYHPVGHDWDMGAAALFWLILIGVVIGGVLLANVFNKDD